jgi:hypothetical protein
MERDPESFRHRRRQLGSGKVAADLLGSWRHSSRKSIFCLVLATAYSVRRARATPIACPAAFVYTHGAALTSGLCGFVA